MLRRCKKRRVLNVRKRREGITWILNPVDLYFRSHRMTKTIYITDVHIIIEMHRLSHYLWFFVRIIGLAISDNGIQSTGVRLIELWLEFRSSKPNTQILEIFELHIIETFKYSLTFLLAIIIRFAFRKIFFQRIETLFGYNFHAFTSLLATAGLPRGSNDRIQWSLKEQTFWFYSNVLHSRCLIETIDVGETLATASGCARCRGNSFVAALWLIEAWMPTGWPRRARLFRSFATNPLFSLVLFLPPPLLLAVLICMDFLLRKASFLTLVGLSATVNRSGTVHSAVAAHEYSYDWNYWDTLAAPLVSAARVKAVGRLSDWLSVCSSSLPVSPACHFNTCVPRSIRCKLFDTSASRDSTCLSSFSSFPSIWIDRYSRSRWSSLWGLIGVVVIDSAFRMVFEQMVSVIRWLDIEKFVLVGLSELPRF